jgi:hypothetical protein
MLGVVFFAGLMGIYGKGWLSRKSQPAFNFFWCVLDGSHTAPVGVNDL